MLTAEQLRGARAMLRWEQATIAEKSGISVETIKRLEKMAGPLTSTRVATLQALKATYQEAGLLFLDPGQVTSGGPGIRLQEAGK